MEEKTGPGRSPRDKGLEGSPRALNLQSLQVQASIPNPVDMPKLG